MDKKVRLKNVNKRISGICLGKPLDVMDFLK